MHISVEVDEPTLNDVKPHYCPQMGRFIGLRFGCREYMKALYCPLCGGSVPERAPGQNYARTVRPPSYDGPRCEHGYPDVPCVELADADEWCRYDLNLSPAIREFHSAVLARRYNCAPHVIDWVRPCPQCRRRTALRREPVLRHELELLAVRLAADLKQAERHVYDLRSELQMLHQAFDELRILSQPNDESERMGLVYLIGHDRAVKIGYTDKHPAKPGGRLGALQTSSSEDLELLGLLEGSVATEREVQRRFGKFYLRGEWFRRAEEIVAYFRENGLEV